MVGIRIHQKRTQLISRDGKVGEQTQLCHDLISTSVGGELNDLFTW